MANVKNTDLLLVPYEKLKIIEGFNIREDMGDLLALADNIQENGLRDPLRGYKEKGEDVYVVTDGHRRHAAMGLFVPGLSDTYYVAFVREPAKYNDEQRVIDMFIMNDGKPLTPLEQAEGVRRMQAYGYSDAEIGTKISRSPSYVGKLASLAMAPKKLIKLIQKGRISASLAMDKISKGETEQFLIDVESGKYDNKEQSDELYQTETPAPAPRITKKDIQSVNSWKSFKTVAKMTDHSKMEGPKAETFKLLCMIMNNEITEDQIKEWFK
jgi:ParB/RepB/Spo0J family partition protein